MHVLVPEFNDFDDGWGPQDSEGMLPTLWSRIQRQSAWGTCNRHSWFHAVSTDGDATLLSGNV